MSIALLLGALADAFDAASAVLRERLAVLTRETAAPLLPGASLSAVERARAIHPQLGTRQEQVLEHLESIGADGASTGAISRAIGYEEPNTYNALKWLVRLGFVEKDESTRPYRYRLTARLRRNGEE
jgi:hypothetical protein